MQRADGAFGSFIVRVPEDLDPHCNLYDYDLTSHVMIISDWGHEAGLEKFIAHHHSNGNNKPINLIVNGLGRYGDNETNYVPTARFVVEQVSRHIQKYFKQIYIHTLMILGLQI